MVSDEDCLLDFWNTPYRYQFREMDVPEITSAGADKKFGTEDDVSNQNDDE